MQPTASLHDQIAESVFVVAQLVFYDAVSFDTRNGMLNAYAY